MNQCIRCSMISMGLCKDGSTRDARWVYSLRLFFRSLSRNDSPIRMCDQDESKNRLSTRQTHHLIIDPAINKYLSVDPYIHQIDSTMTTMCHDFLRISFLVILLYKFIPTHECLSTTTHPSKLKIKKTIHVFSHRTSLQGHDASRKSSFESHTNFSTNTSMQRRQQKHIPNRTKVEISNRKVSSHRLNSLLQG